MWVLCAHNAIDGVRLHSFLLRSGFFLFFFSFSAVRFVAASESMVIMRICYYFLTQLNDAATVCGNAQCVSAYSTLCAVQGQQAAHVISILLLVCIDQMQPNGFCFGLLSDIVRNKIISVAAAAVDVVVVVTVFAKQFILFF